MPKSRKDVTELANRTRTNRNEVYLSDDEQYILNEKFKLSGMKSKADFLRRLMAYQITFTKQFEKHFKNLNAQEKKQLQNKLQLLSKNLMHPSLRTKRIQGPGIFLSAASTWISISPGTMRATK